VIAQGISGDSIHSFTRNRFDRLDDAVRDDDIVTARELCRAVRAEYLIAHDGFRNAIAAALSHAVNVTSPEEGEALGRRVAESSMEGGDLPQYAQASIVDRVRTIAAGWHWHATDFTITEDDEKFTFHLGPCGSGMRLLREGAYDGEGAWHRSRRPSPSNFMQVGFPMYSNHCAEATRMALINGSATFIVEGWTPMRTRGLCIQHTFKDFSAVPAEFYERVGLTPPDPSARTTLPGGKRLCTEDELDEMATHPLDRLIRRMERKDREGALAALADCQSGWRDSIHDVYRLWINLLWKEMERAFGHAELVRALEITAPELIKGVVRGSARDWAAFWSIHLRLREVRRTGDDWEFVIGSESLLEPEEYPGYPESVEEFCGALNRGMRERGWKESGWFEGRGEMMVHHFSEIVEDLGDGALCLCP
jgi:hypothetical protein